MTKQQILELVEKMPNEVDSEEVIYRLYLRGKLDRAEAAVANGEVISHDEVVRESQKWFE
jgi:hypothetical protein